MTVYDWTVFKLPRTAEPRTVRGQRAKEAAVVKFT
jgi:hypothetical protein